MSRLRTAALLGLAFHFSLLGLGMLRVQLPPPFGQWQRNYARVTGGGGSFGFFSPNAPRELDVRFAIETNGGTREEKLEDALPAEVQARVGNMVHLLASHYGNAKAMRSLAASFTAEMFRLHPQARSIRMTASFLAFPSPEEYRAGKRAELKKVYSARFTPRPAQSAAGAPDA